MDHIKSDTFVCNLLLERWHMLIGEVDRSYKESGNAYGDDICTIDNYMRGKSWWINGATS